MRKNYPHRVSGLAFLFLLQVQERVMQQRHPSRGLAGSRAKRAYANLTRTLRACLHELTRPSPFSFPKSAASEAFVCPSKGCNST